ncbi:hypothetical protein ABW20_dc0106909 [Dactylellina cionopaga]|nr:hypothetical protein ABW20_dc0106909 [Dactylellina cionopaga]
MSDLDFMPGEKEVGVWAATASENIDIWLREVESWEALTFWSKADGDGFRIPEGKGQRKKRRKVDLSSSGSTRDVDKKNGLPVARKLFSDAAASSSASLKGAGGRVGGIPTLHLDKKTKEAISMSQIDELLSPTTTPLMVKRLDFDFATGGNGTRTPTTPSRMWSAGTPLSPFSPGYEKPVKRRSLQVGSSFGNGGGPVGGGGATTPTIMKRQTFDFTPGHRGSIVGTLGGMGYRPSSSPTKTVDGNPFLNVHQQVAPTSNPGLLQAPSPTLDPATDSETDFAPGAESEADDTEDGEADENADVEFLGSLTASNLNYISSRVVTVSTDLSQLDIEGLKSRVLHFKSQQIDEQGNGRMSDSLAIITATTLQLLPPLHRLWHLLEIWGVRTEVCRVVPTFLGSLVRAENIVMNDNTLNGDGALVEKEGDEGARWLEEIDEGVGEQAINEATLQTLERGVDGVWEKRKTEIVDLVGVCGKIIDGMLDVLEGREETVPEEWIDRLEAMESALESWVFGEERRAEGLKRKWRDVITRRRQEEERKRRDEVERLRREELERRRREEEVERLRREEEERLRILAEEERLRKIEEERLRQIEEERIRKGEEERLRQEKEERLQREEEERVRKVTAERLRLEEEERLRKAEEDRIQKAAEEERIRREAEEELSRQQEAARLQAEEEERLKKDEEERQQQLAEEEFNRQLAEAEAERRKAEERRIRELEERMIAKYEAMERAAEEEEARKQAESAALALNDGAGKEDTGLSLEEVAEPVSEQSADPPLEESILPTTPPTATKEIPQLVATTEEALDIAISNVPPQPDLVNHTTQSAEPQLGILADFSMLEAEINGDGGVIEVLPSISEDLEEIEAEKVEAEHLIVPKLVEIEPVLQPAATVESKEISHSPLSPQLQDPLLVPIAKESQVPMLVISGPINATVVGEEEQVSVVQSDTPEAETNVEVGQELVENQSSDASSLELLELEGLVDDDAEIGLDIEDEDTILIDSEEISDIGLPLDLTSEIKQITTPLVIDEGNDLPQTNSELSQNKPEPTLIPRSLDLVSTPVYSAYIAAEQEDTASQPPSQEHAPVVENEHEPVVATVHNNQVSPEEEVISRLPTPTDAPVVQSKLEAVGDIPKAILIFSLDQEDIILPSPTLGPPASLEGRPEIPLSPAQPAELEQETIISPTLRGDAEPIQSILEPSPDITKNHQTPLESEVELEDIDPPSPIQTPELALQDIHIETIPVSPLQTPVKPDSRIKASKSHLDVVTALERPISPILELPEVPIVKIQAATPIEGRHGSVALDLAEIANQLEVLHFQDVYEEAEPGIRVVISDVSNDGLVEMSEEGGDIMSVNGGQSFALKDLPAEREQGISPALATMGPHNADTLQETEEIALQPEAAIKVSPFLAPITVIDDYVSDIDDSDVETVADDEEFQAELRKERLVEEFGQHLDLASTSANKDSVAAMATAPRQSNIVPPPRRNKKEAHSNSTKTISDISKETHHITGGENKKDVLISQTTKESPIKQAGPAKLSSPFHPYYKDALADYGNQPRHDSFDSMASKSNVLDQSFSSFRSLEVSRELASPLSPTGSVIIHQIGDSFGQSFGSVLSNDATVDVTGPDLYDDQVIEKVPDTPSVEEEVSPIKEDFDEGRFKYSVSSESTDFRLDEPDFGKSQSKISDVSKNGTRPIDDRAAWEMPAPVSGSSRSLRLNISANTLLEFQPKPRKSSASSVSSSTFVNNSKKSDTASGPIRSHGQPTQHVRRVSSIPTIAPPRKQAQKESNTQSNRSISYSIRHSHSQSHSQVQRQPSRGEDLSSHQNLRTESRMSSIPRKASSSNLPTPIPARSSSFNKTDPPLPKKKRSSISGSTSRDITPKASAQEPRNIPSRTSSRMSSLSSLRGQSSRQSLRGLPSPSSSQDPTSPTFETTLRNQSSRQSLRGIPQPYSQQSTIHRQSPYQAHHTSSPTYDSGQAIKVVKRKPNITSKPSIRMPQNEIRRDNGTTSPVSPIEFPTLRPMPNPPSTPMQGRELEDRLEKKINKILIGLPSLTMTPSPMKRGPPLPINTAIETTTRPSKLGESKLPIARTPSTPTIGQAPNLTTSSKRTISQPGEVKMYHLHKSDEESPVKLFVRLVGDRGERVMVRVGGGWADLKEYLIEYAAHHGIQGTRKMAAESVVEFGEDARSIKASGSNSSLRSSFRGSPRGSPTPTFGNSRPSSPLASFKNPVPSTSRGNTPNRAESPYLSRRPESPGSRSQMGTSPGLRYGMSNTQSQQQQRSSPGASNHDRPVTPGSAGLYPSYTSPTYNSGLSANFRRPTSRLSFGDFPDTMEPSPSSPILPSVPLGLAGPKSRNMEISAEKQAWVDGMLGQVRKASAERNVRLGLQRMGSASNLQGGDEDGGSNSSIGTIATGNGPRLSDMGKVGGTRRMYASKTPSYLGLQKGGKGSSSSLRLSEPMRRSDTDKEPGRA